MADDDNAVPPARSGRARPEFDLNYVDRRAVAPTPPSWPESSRSIPGPHSYADSAPSRPFVATLPSTLLSAAVFLAAESYAFGFWFAVGMTAMIALHECGHAVAARRYRRGYEGMYFVPLMGAFVRLRGRAGRPNRAEDAVIGLAGPAFGGGVGLVFVALGMILHQALFVSLARMTFGLNLMNLIPVQPLDGSWIYPATRSKIVGASPAADRLRITWAYAALVTLLFGAFVWSSW